MGKPRSAVLRAEVKLSLPAPLVAEMDLLLEDPLTQKPKYGARSRLIESLLRNWLATVRGEAEASQIPTLDELRTG